MVKLTASGGELSRVVVFPVAGDTPPDIDFSDRHGYSPTVSPDTVRRYKSAISDLAGHGFKEQGYPVVDYESDLQTAMSTTV
ncbi:hypothetical protein [Oryza sativa Japonica Group]|uniref:Uncharacterized protein P0510F03.27 n=1 Tax=Oryza sativa subsp. japonica TaxID=39947 RepID=Q9LGQ0_ORYSJ|nr:hypothetical protein [Oryza sativa Japonica Group]